MKAPHNVKKSVLPMMAMALVASSFMSGLTACSLKKDVDDMHDATVQMNERTKRLADSTDEMKERTKKLHEGTEVLQAATCEMYDALKQGDSLTARRASLQQMIDAKESARKISEAGKYFMAFELQLWSGICQDNHEKREEVAASAVREFLRDVQEFIKAGQVDAEPFAHGNGGEKGKGDEGNLARCLNALSVALHTTNPKQAINLHKHPDEPKLSMYSLIQDALKAKVEIEAGRARLEQYPEYVREILVNEKTVTLLLQARYNFLGAMAISRVSKVREGVLEYLKMVYGDVLDSVAAHLKFFSRGSDSLDFRWELNLEDSNSVEIKEYSKYLKEAMKAYDFMKQVGIEPRMAKDLSRMLKNMKIKSQQIKGFKNGAPEAESKDDKKKPVVVSERVSIESDFLGLFEVYRRSGQTLAEREEEKAKALAEEEEQAKQEAKAQAKAKKTLPSPNVLSMPMPELTTKPSAAAVQAAKEYFAEKEKQKSASGANAGSTASNDLSTNAQQAKPAAQPGPSGNATGEIDLVGP